MFLNIMICHAHQDFYVTKTFDNLTVRIKTGYEYEEINKLKILGELGQRMLEKADYKGKILIDFNHYYTGKCEPDYFISYDNGSIKYTWDNNLRPKPVLSSSGLVIRIVSSRLDYKKTLELLNYAIENKDYIKKNQDEIKYVQNYCQWFVNSIDTVEIKNILNRNQSIIVSEILKQKVYVADSTWNFGTSYFYQNDSFNFLVRAYNGIPDTVALSVKNVYQVVQVGSGSKIIFDTDSSFYYVGWYGNRVVSQRHIVENTKNNYQGFSVKEIGDDMLTIYFSRFATKEEEEKGIADFYYSQTSIYDIKNDKWVPDIRRNLIER